MEAYESIETACVSAFFLPPLDLYANVGNVCDYVQDIPFDFDSESDEDIYFEEDLDIADYLNPVLP